MSEDFKLKPKRAVAREFGVCTRTIDRWHNDKELGFPKPVVINKRCYFNEDALDRFKVDCARRTASSNAIAA